MNWRHSTCTLTLAAGLLAGCDFDFGSGPGGAPTPSPTPTPTGTPFIVTVDFTTDATWSAGFSDFSPGMESQVQFANGLHPVPPNVGGNGFFLAGDNPADDVALYVWRRVENLTPGTNYKIETRVDLATNSPSDCFGIGGAPGEAVAFKAGASDLEPALLLNAEGLMTLNLDKANQSESGEDLKVIGHLASPEAGTCEAPVYAKKALDSGGEGPTVRSSADGSLWLVLSTDSGYEGRTEVYLLNARIEITRQ
jgi:hypothetical protein